MKYLKIRNNFRSQRDDNILFLRINDQIFQISSSSPSVKFDKVGIKKADEYQISLELDDKVYKEIKTDTLEDKYIYVKTNKANPLLGMRGKLYSSIVIAFTDEYTFKIKKDKYEEK